MISKTRIYIKNLLPFVKLAMFIFFSFIISYKLHPYFAAVYKEFIGISATIISIMAGFLMGSIALSSDTAIKYLKSWNNIHSIRSLFLRKMRFYNLILFLYMTCLIFSLIMMLLPEKAFTDMDMQNLQFSIEITYIGLTFFSILLSFNLPKFLTNIQIDKFEIDAQDLEPKYLKDAKRTIRDQVIDNK